MVHDMLTRLASWGPLDTAVVLVAATAAAACALPGAFLVLRRQSMLGDALSHTSLLGIVLGYLLVEALLPNGLTAAGLIPPSQAGWYRSFALFAGATVVGIGTGVLTEWIRVHGQVEASAALGTVYTTAFALGLLLIRWAADSIDLDPGCVLFGSLELTVLETVPGFTLGGIAIPWALVGCGAMLAINIGLVLLFLKELTAATFDPIHAAALGLPVRAIETALIAVTAATLTAAFKSVGSILVIAMLIVPAASAYLLTDRLGRMLTYAVLLAALAAVLGQIGAIALPGPIFDRLGFRGVESANTAGMTALAAGGLFLGATIFGPRHGLVRRLWDRLRLRFSIATEDLLGILYRCEEDHLPAEFRASFLREHAAEMGLDGIVGRLARRHLLRMGWIEPGPDPLPRLTDSGRTKAAGLVRSHRLWESYLAAHTGLPADHLHAAAHRVEHYIDPALQNSLAEELQSPPVDPHGRTIPADPRPGA